MEISNNAILIELDDTLFSSDEENFGLLKIYQELDPEVKELFQDMQTYAHLIGFCNLDHRFHSVLLDRLESENLNFAQLITVSGDNYLKAKRDAYNTFSGKYSISCYIDEKEESPWHANLKISRLRMR
jgi:hypothetical protein